jgi:hypothetical protein
MDQVPMKAGLWPTTLAIAASFLVMAGQLHAAEKKIRITRIYSDLYYNQEVEISWAPKSFSSAPKSMVILHSSKAGRAGRPYRWLYPFRSTAIR